MFVCVRRNGEKKKVKITCKIRVLVENGTHCDSAFAEKAVSAGCCQDVWQQHDIVSYLENSFSPNQIDKEISLCSYPIPVEGTPLGRVCIGCTDALALGCRLASEWAPAQAHTSQSLRFPQSL